MLAHTQAAVISRSSVAPFVAKPVPDPIGPSCLMNRWERQLLEATAIAPETQLRMFQFLLKQKTTALAFNAPGDSWFGDGVFGIFYPNFDVCLDSDEYDHIENQAFWFVFYMWFYRVFDEFEATRRDGGYAEDWDDYDLKVAKRQGGNTLGLFTECFGLPAFSFQDPRMAGLWGMFDFDVNAFAQVADDSFFAGGWMAQLGVYGLTPCPRTAPYLMLAIAVVKQVSDLVQDRNGDHENRAAAALDYFQVIRPKLFPAAA